MANSQPIENTIVINNNYYNMYCNTLQVNLINIIVIVSDIVIDPDIIMTI